MRTRTHPKSAVLLAVAILALSGCRQEERAVRTAPPGGVVLQGVRQIELQPGPAVPAVKTNNPFAGNAHAIAEGKRLYEWFNCSGCHAAGGGAIGPPLMDDQWIYGKDSQNVFSSIVEGRPQGMPAYGGRIPEYQVWQIVSFVRAMSGLDEGTSSQTLHSQPTQQGTEGVKGR